MRERAAARVFRRIGSATNTDAAAWLWRRPWCGSFGKFERGAVRSLQLYADAAVGGKVNLHFTIKERVVAV